MGLIQNVILFLLCEFYSLPNMSIFSANDFEISNHRQHVEQQDDYAVPKSSSHLLDNQHINTFR